MQYLKSPIREAVFDIQVEKLSVNNVNDLKIFSSHVKDEFAKSKKRHNFSSTIHLDNEEPLTITEKTESGYIFSNENNTRQLQVTLQGFTLNIQPPYESWDIHFAQFFKYWKIYRELFSPKIINRVASRYINQIKIPNIKSISEYIINMPSIPQCLPQDFSAFFMQTQVPVPEKIKTVTITQTVQKDILENGTFFILDIDVYQDKGLSNMDEKIENIFNEIRVLKNSVFENCITQMAKDTFK